MLYAYGSGQQWERMQATYDMIKDAGITLNSFTFETLINAYAKGGQGDRLDAVLRVSVATAPHSVPASIPPTAPRGLSRALHTYTACFQR